MNDNLMTQEEAMERLLPIDPIEQAPEAQPSQAEAPADPLYDKPGLELIHQIRIANSELRLIRLDRLQAALRKEEAERRWKDNLMEGLLAGTIVGSNDDKREWDARQKFPELWEAWQQAKISDTITAYQLECAKDRVKEIRTYIDATLPVVMAEEEQALEEQQ